MRKNAIPRGASFPILSSQYHFIFQVAIPQFQHLLLMDPVSGTFVGFGFSPVLLSSSSGIAVSCFSVLTVCPVSNFRVRGFQFFRFICLFCPTLGSV